MGVGSQLIFANPAGIAGAAGLAGVAALDAAGFAGAGALEVAGAVASRLRLQRSSKAEIGQSCSTNTSETSFYSSKMLSWHY
jgi:hypothetical protein